MAIRAFLALPLSEDLVEALAEVQAELRTGRIVPPENLHLTLAFLDDQPEAQLAALDGELRAAPLPRPHVRITGIGTMGGRLPRVVMASVASDPALVALRTRARGAARAVGIELPRARFRPHVTLARLRPAEARQAAAPLAAFLGRHGGAGFPAEAPDRMILYRSTLAPQGATYDPLADYPLGTHPR